VFGSVTTSNNVQWIRTKLKSGWQGQNADDDLPGGSPPRPSLDSSSTCAFNPCCSTWSGSEEAEVCEQPQKV
jgi:hypothetical protein